MVVDFCVVLMHIDPIHGAEFQRLIFGVQDHIDHRTHLGRDDIVGGDERDGLLQPLLISRFRSLDARLDHVASHQLQALFQMLPELGVWPMKIPNERLESVQFPEEIF